MSNEQYAQTGRMMFIFAWLIVFGFLFLFFYYYSESEGSYEIVHGEVRITSDSQGHYRIPGHINSYSVHFLLDTGATLVAIPQSVARRLELDGRYPVRIQTAGGEIEGLLTRLQQLSFGQFILHDVKAVIVPDMQDKTVLLGMNVLSQFNLSQQDNQLVIKK